MSRTPHGWFPRGPRAKPGGVAARVAGTDLTRRRLHDRALDRAAAPTGPRRGVGVLGARGADANAALPGALHPGAGVVPLSAEYPVEPPSRQPMPN